MKFFNGNARSFNDSNNAYWSALAQEEADLIRESGIGNQGAMDYLFNNRRHHVQPRFSMFRNVNEFATDLQSLIARPVICLWLAKVHALRATLEFGLFLLYVFTLNGNNANAHLSEAIASYCAVVCHNLKAEIHLITETLYVGLRLALTVGAASNTMLNALTGLFHEAPLERRGPQNII